MTCKDCVHDDVCPTWNYRTDDFVERNPKDCRNFKNKADYQKIENNKNTNYTKLTSMSVSELTDWIDINGDHDDSPWIKWFNDKYCANCEPILLTREEVKEKNLGLEMWYYDKHEFSYCEVHSKCRFFDEVPDIKEIIKMWLEEEIE